MAVKSAENARLQIEAGQTLQAFVALTDVGDNQTYESADSLFSGVSGKEPDIKPNGVATGLAVTPKSSTNDTVSVAAGTVYLAGVLTSVSADDVAITRGVDGDEDYRIISITVNSSGVLAAVLGTVHASAHSEVRGAAGGPPSIPLDSIEIAQVRITDYTAAVLTSDEIFTIEGTHRERYDFPVWDEHMSNANEDYDGDYAGIKFASALPLIHGATAGAAATNTKAVYAQYYTPDFSNVDKVSDFVAPEESHSVGSKAIYGGALGSKSSSLGQGSFVAYLQDGVSDNIVTLKNLNLWFKFFPDRAVTDKYLLSQGYLGITRQFPADDSIQASCTISAKEAATEVKA